MCSRTPHSLWAGCSGLAVLGAWIALCSAPAIGQMEEIKPRKGRVIEGQVRVMGHGPIPLDVAVVLEQPDGAVVSQRFVGNDGVFRFENLSGSEYRLIVTAKGFQTANQAVEMDLEASRHPTIYLVPLEKRPTSSAASAESPTDLAAPKKARKEYEKGSRSLHDGNLEEARKHLENAVAEDPCYARAQTALGETLIMQRQFAAAESAFSKSIKCDGQFLEAYVLLAVLLNTERKHKECEAELQQGLRLFPNEWRLHYQLGIAEAGSGDYDQAETAYLKAQSINPNVPPEFHLRLAGVYLKWKKQDKAYAELESYLRADPHGRFAESTRKMMQQLEASGAVTNGKTEAAPVKP